VGVKYSSMPEQNKSSAERALALAVALERHNAQRFREWANRFRAYDSRTSTFLEGLAQEESEHEKLLLELYQRQFGEDTFAHPPGELARYEAGLASIKNHFLVLDRVMARTLLEMALEIERYTRQYYVDLLERTTDPDLAAVYRQLAEFESEHERAFLARLKEQRGRDE
jgi:rubrerythrin